MQSIHAAIAVTSFSAEFEIISASLLGEYQTFGAETLIVGFLLGWI